MSGMQKIIQAKDIDDLVVLRRVAREHGTGRPFVMVVDLLDELPDVPEKVVRAKARALVLRGLLDGCSNAGCRCRMDLSLTDAGREAVGT
jgi:hypothetical protein